MGGGEEGRKAGEMGKAAGLNNPAFPVCLAGWLAACLPAFHHPKWLKPGCDHC